MRTTVLIALTAFVSTSASTVCAETIQVPGDAPTIQGGIDLASDGDTVAVGPGVYHEAIDLDGKAIHLLATAGPDVTTIDGSGSGTSTVELSSGEDRDTIIEGFRITGGEGQLFIGDLMGGGMFLKFTDPTLINCTFQDNDLIDDGPYKTTGGGIAMFAADPLISHCRFIGNSVQFGDGGGAIAMSSSDPEIQFCTFIKNSAGFSGGAINCVGGDGTITNCLFVGNEAALGAGIRLSGTDSTIVNSTFTGNVAQFGAGIRGSSNGVSHVSNCILWGNVPDQMEELAGALLIVDNCIIEGDWAGEGIGVIDSDPLFMDAFGIDGIPASGDEDLRVASHSPAVDTGNNEAASGDFKFDLSGLRREVDGDGDGSQHIDLGPFESQDVHPASDFDRDGSITVTDLLFMLEHWGACPPGSAECIADLDHNNVVDSADFLIFIFAWQAD